MTDITPREAFKLGFVQRCVEEGLSPEQTRLRMEKAASAFDDSMFSPRNLYAALAGLSVTPKGAPMGSRGATAPGNISNKAMLGLASLGIALPIVAGAGAGHLARSLQPEMMDAEAVRKQELINEANALAAKAKHSGSAALGL